MILRAIGIRELILVLVKIENLGKPKEAGHRQVWLSICSLLMHLISRNKKQLFTAVSFLSHKSLNTLKAKCAFKNSATVFVTYDHCVKHKVKKLLQRLEFKKKKLRARHLKIPSRVDLTWVFQSSFNSRLLFRLKFCHICNQKWHLL